MSGRSEAGDLLGANAFAVFANQIATEVANENAKLEEESAFLEPLRDHFSSVEIRTGNQVLALSGLGSAEIDQRGTIVIRISSEDGATLPLKKYGFDGNANLYVSKQLVGKFPGSFNPHVTGVEDDGSLGIMIHDHSGTACVRGRLQNLSCEDLEKIMGEDSGATEFECKTIGRYLREGVGLNSANITFVPDLVFIIPTSGRKGPDIFKSALLVQRPFIYEVGVSLQIIQESIKKMTLALKSLQGNHDKLAREILQPQPSFRRKNLKRVLKGVKVKVNLIARRRFESVLLERQVRAQKERLDAHFPASLKEYLESIETSPSDELRKSVFAVDNRPENTALLRQNLKLRLKKQNLKDIQSRIGAVELSFHDGDLSLSLRTGFKSSLGDTKDVWCIPLTSGQTRSIEANKLHSLEVYVSGVYSRRVTGRMLRPNLDDLLSIPFEIGYDSGLCLGVCLQFGSRDSLLEIHRAGSLASLARAMHAAITGRERSLSLPADCVIRLRSIHFSLDSIMDTLAMMQLPSSSDST